MKNFFKIREEKHETNLINKLFSFEGLEDENDIIDNYFNLKRNIISLPELSKNNNTINIILSLFLFNANLMINDNNISKKEQKLELLKKELFKNIKNHDAFHFFLYNNKIDDKTLMKLIPNLKYEYILKNTNFSKEGDNSSKMYFILKGKVSFRKKINSLKSPKITDIEKYSLEDYQNFGQWDIIYERKRKLSFYSLENCHLISIEKEYFKKYLEEKIVKGDSEKKSFITKFLRSYMTLSAYKIEGIIQNIKTLYFRKGEIIYKEGDINRSLFLIYKGEAKLIKKIKNGEFHFIGKLNDNINNLQKKARKINYNELIKSDTNEDENKNLNDPNYIYNMKYLKPKNKTKEKTFPLTLDLLLDKQTYQDIFILGKGCIGGLEITTGILKNKYTMVSNNDYTTIFQLELKMVDDHLKEFMINLLPKFFQDEKEIHSRIKQIKYIDNNIIPLNCKKYKINDNANNYLSLENNGNVIKKIRKINDKFDTKEGGFIIMNNFNMDLNNQKNLLKDKLKENRINDNKIDNLLREYDEKEKSKLKFTEVKMHKKPKIIKINENSSKYQIINSKNNNGNFYNLNNNGFFTERNKYTSIENSKFNQSKKYFINSNKEKDSKNKKLLKNMSERDFTKKTLEIFDKIIEIYRKRKEFSKLDIFSPIILKTDSSERSKRKKTLGYEVEKENMLLKEVIVLNNNGIDSYSANKFINKYNDKIYRSNKKRYLSGRNNINKKLNKKKLKELNIYNYDSDEKKDEDIFIINKNFLKKIILKNMISKRNQKTFYTNNFNKDFIKKRMIYYNTGKYDMPFVSQLTLKK